MLNQESPKMASTDRVLVLAPVEGAKTLSSKGLTDNRLFTGDNKLHVVREEDTGFWYFKMDKGGLPPHLDERRFTGYSAALKYTKDYYKTRNVEIKEVIL